MLGLVQCSSVALGIASLVAANAGSRGTPPPPPIRIAEGYIPEQCDLPLVPRGARLVVFGANGGEAISSAVIGNQNVVTRLIDVNIEPGSDPLYVVLTSASSMIWRISGVKDRVVRVAVSSAIGDRAEEARPQVDWVPLPGAVSPKKYERAAKPRSLSGVIGISKTKVTIAHTNCPPYFNDLGDGQAEKVRRSIYRSVGRAPDVIVGKYSTGEVSLPSGRVTAFKRSSMPLGFDATTWAEAIRFWPGGLVRVNLANVVASSTVAPYLVLPSPMGLSQLVGSKAIQRERSDAFRVIRPIAHMPPGMYGGLSVRLTFAEGVPIAPGNPGHSCIVQESTGEHRGARCGIGER